MIENERESRHEHILNVARQMMTAARTAPKGKGVDIIEIAMVTDSNLRILSETMKQMYEENGLKFFLRAASGTELRALRFPDVCRQTGRSALCHQQC